MNLRGQGALEYLLLIGGAVLIAAIAIAILSGSGGQAGGQLSKNVWEANCAPYGSQDQCNTVDLGIKTASTGGTGTYYCDTTDNGDGLPVDATDNDCVWDTTNNKCIANVNCK